MRSNWKLAAILGLAIALFPSAAFANAGTPLMWTAVQHLILGNAAIGALEAILLSKWFRTPFPQSTRILIEANYISAGTGLFLLAGRFYRIPRVTLENAYLWLWLCVAFTFLLTLLVEYPFFWFLLRKQEKAVRKALKATLVIHSISYLLLFGWYGFNSQTSLVTQLDVVPVAQLQPPEEYVLYFITADGKQVVRSDLEGKRQKVVKEVEALDRTSQLLACKNQEDRFDLLTRIGGREQIVLSDFASAIPVYPQFHRSSESSHGDRCRSNYFGRVPKLTNNTNWDYQTVVWAAGGIMGQNEKENLSFSFAFETPFAFWYVRYATHLAGDFVVFELDGDRICILQPQEKKIAFITAGQKPIVVKPKP